MRCFSCLQAELFDKFLHGSTLEECYSAVAAVANRWLDLLDVCKISFCFSNDLP
jgi:DNA polymerase epsilon subunit 1